jgi:hypothetical protein
MLPLSPSTHTSIHTCRGMQHPEPDAHCGRLLLCQQHPFLTHSRAHTNWVQQHTHTHAQADRHTDRHTLFTDSRARRRCQGCTTLPCLRWLWYNHHSSSHSQAGADPAQSQHRSLRLTDSSNTNTTSIANQCCLTSAPLRDKTPCHPHRRRS